MTTTTTTTTTTRRNRKPDAQALANAAPATESAQSIRARDLIAGNDNFTEADRADRSLLIDVVRVGKRVIAARKNDEMPSGIAARLNWTLYRSRLYGTDGIGKAKDAVTIAADALIPHVPSDVRAMINGSDAIDCIHTFLRHKDSGWVCNVLKFCSTQTKKTEPGFAKFARGLSRAEAVRVQVQAGLDQSAAAKAKVAAKAAK